MNGTGTIGEPLIALLLSTKKNLGIDELFFYKHTARLTDRPMIENLQKKGGSHQHLHLVHPHPQVKESFRRNPLLFAKAGTQGKRNVPIRGQRSLESSRKVLKVSHSKPLMDLMGM